MENGELKQIPSYLRTIMIFIDRVGFPIFAFVAILIVLCVYVNSVNKTMKENVTTLSTLTQATMQWQNEVRDVHNFQNDCLNSLTSDCNISPSKRRQ